jgi:hypothetical protein
VRRRKRRRIRGDLVGLRVAVELEQVGLQGVEGVDADAAGEQRLDHQPLDRRHPPAVVDRVGGDLPHLGQRPPTLLRCEPDVVHEPEGEPEHHDQDEAADHERHAEAGLAGDEAAGDRADQHRRAADDLATAEDRLQLTGVAGRGERVDQPGLDRAGEEGEAEPEQHRGERPLPERRSDLPEQHVEKGRRHQRQRSEQVGDAAPDRVGDDPRRHLEQHHPGGEEGVRRERFQVREPGIEQEDRVDPPDQRRRQRVAEQQRQVGALYRAGGRHHPHAVRARTRRAVPRARGRRTDDAVGCSR